MFGLFCFAFRHTVAFHLLNTTQRDRAGAGSGDYPDDLERRASGSHVVQGMTYSPARGNGGCAERRHQLGTG